jgi:hypothetical protein
MTTVFENLISQAVHIELFGVFQGMTNKIYAISFCNLPESRFNMNEL